MPQARLQQIARFRPFSASRFRTFRHYHGSAHQSAASAAITSDITFNDLRVTEQIRPPRMLVVRSHTNDPYTNLAIENYLLNHSQPESRIYFFYVNRPCIVIGRNQNPWLEVNLRKLRESSQSWPVDLIRRRSGGGTVFHDHGNLNYCAIMPPKGFTRNLHAQALADALNAAAIEKATGHFKVNDRHDVVLVTEDGVQLKVSGSAYKLTKGRALHHGTCLVASPNLSQISQYLRSPAKAFVSAKGVESVSSKISNVSTFSDSTSERKLKLGNVMDEIIDHFLVHSTRNSSEYDLSRNTRYHYTNGLEYTNIHDGNVPESQDVVKEILADVSTLKDRNWKYLQTPRFTFTSHPQQHPTPDAEDSKAPSSPPSPSPSQEASPAAAAAAAAAAEKFPGSFSLHRDERERVRVRLHVKAGVIEASEVSCLRPDVALEGRVLHQIADWRALVADAEVGEWMNRMLACPDG